MVYLRKNPCHYYYVDHFCSTLNVLVNICMASRSGQLSWHPFVARTMWLRKRMKFGCVLELPFAACFSLFKVFRVFRDCLLADIFWPTLFLVFDPFAGQTTCIDKCRVLGGN